MGNERKFYRKHMRLKTVLKTVALVLLAVIVLLVATFLWFKRYIVYTEDGLYLDVPWLSDDVSPDGGDDTEPVDVPDTPSTDSPTDEPVTDTPVDTGTPVSDFPNYDSPTEPPTDTPVE